MGSDYSKSVEQLKQMSLQDLIGIIASHNEPTVVQHAKHIYEEKILDEQRVCEAKQIELKFKKNRENIEYQHSLNKQIVEKQTEILKQQVSAMRTSMIITAAATLIAAILGVVLGDMITRNKEQKPIQIRIDSDQLTQLRATTTVSKPSTNEKKINNSSHNLPHAKEK